MKIRIFIACMLLLFFVEINAQSLAKKNVLASGKVWLDEKGEVINAHGGCVLYQNGRYYWFGEKRGTSASEGVNVYSSSDLYNWKFEALALAQDSANEASPIAKGCVMERPKVIYNSITKQYVLWFHLELKGKGYSAARAAVAISDSITGPYKFINSFRPNGNMSRDMTLFKDDDGAAYLIYSSRENYDLRIAKLTDDFLSVTTKDTMLFSNHREAPALFKYNKKYYLITSGCTGWQANKASLHSTDNLWGQWLESPINPMFGNNADKTFGGQSTYVLPIANKQNQFVFIADEWHPDNLKDSRYFWLPIQLDDKVPTVHWIDEWQLNWFDKTNSIQH